MACGLSRSYLWGLTAHVPSAFASSVVGWIMLARAKRRALEMSELSLGFAL